MIVAVILAAGQSRRMGRPKQTLRLGGKSMLQMVLDSYRKTDVDEIVVVLGARAEEVSNTVNFDRERVVYNPEYQQGMSGSLRLGLAALGPKSDAIIVALADQPFVSPSTVNKLIRAYKGSGADAVVPVHKGTRGNPVLLAKTLFPEIAAIRGDVGAKSVLTRHESSLLEVPVEDRGVLADIDTPDDYAKAVSRKSRATSLGKRNRAR